MAHTKIPPTIQTHSVLKGSLFTRQPARMMAVAQTSGGSAVASTLARRTTLVAW